MRKRWRIEFQDKIILRGHIERVNSANEGKKKMELPKNEEESSESLVSWNQRSGVSMRLVTVMSNASDGLWKWNLETERCIYHCPFLHQRNWLWALEKMVLIIKQHSFKSVALISYLSYNGIHLSWFKQVGPLEDITGH